MDNNFAATLVPTTIVAISARALGSYGIGFSWQSTSSPYTYTFTAINLNDSSFFPIVETVVNAAYNLSLDIEWTCDFYEIHVSSDDNSSITLGTPYFSTYNLPLILPADLSHIVDTLSYKLEESGQGVEIIVTFEVCTIIHLSIMHHAKSKRKL